MNKKSRQSMFQVLLLDNGDSQDVEVHEAEQVDFYQVKEHLKNGGSVFITSNELQKINYPRTNAQRNYNRSRKTLRFLSHQHMRSQ